MAKVVEELDMPTEEDMAGVDFENNEDGLVVNLADVEELKFELLPKGKYDIIIEDNTYAKSKSAGQPMWNLKLNVEGGEYDGRKVFDIFSFSPKALPGTKTRLAIIAPELMDKDFKVNDPEVVASLIGRRARIQVDIRPEDEAAGYSAQNIVKRWFHPSGAFI